MSRLNGPNGLCRSGRVRSGRARIVEFSYKLTMPPSSDARPLVCRQALSTAPDSPAGQLATADTC